MNTPQMNSRRFMELLQDAWKLAFGAGLITLILGILIVIDPGTSLIVVSILIGIDFVISGAYRLLRSLTDETSHNRTLWAVIGIILMLVGLFLIKHFGVTLLLVSTLVGVFWIVSGVTELSIGFGAWSSGAGIWFILTGIIGTIAGIVVLAYPVGSLLTLALLVGIWLIIRGVAQMAAALAARRYIKAH